jgi:hypothetical protein
MSPAEMRAVLAELQAQFSVSERSYETYEPSPRPVDDLPGATGDARAAALAAFEEAGAGGGWVYVVGGVLTVGVILLFLYLALYGPAPFRATPAASPSAPTAASSSP